MKKCNKCREFKTEDQFWKHNSRKDGFQAECKECQRTSYLTALTCTLCEKIFHVNHRNIRKRRHAHCKECISQKLIERNKNRTKGYSTTHQKGYLYVRDLTEKHHYKLEHRKVMEDVMGRNLTKNEQVHHIDGDKSNNDINNLWLTNNTDHALAHNSLEFIAFELVRNGAIVFDRESGQYKLRE